MAASALLAIMLAESGLRDSPEEVYDSALLALLILGIPLLMFATERDELPANVRLPRRAWIAALVAPWLPGGGRGALFLVLHLAAAYGVMAGVAAANEELSAVARSPERGVVRAYQIQVTCLFAATYVLLPCAIASRFADTAMRAWLLRTVIPLSMIGSWYISATLSGFDRQSLLGLIAELTSPFELGTLVTWDGRAVGHAYALIALRLIVLLALLGNAPRMVRGVAEAVEASSRRSA